MNPATHRALLDINRRFYERFAEGFSRSRKAPWPGWEQILPFLPDTRSPLRILDVGCGNGRFAHFLRTRLSRPLDYVGLDGSSQLLTAARQSSGSAAEPNHFYQVELTSASELVACLGRESASNRFDLIAVFGVLHHLPGRRARARWMETLAPYLRSEGIMALTFWRFEQLLDRPENHVPWEEHNRDNLARIDTRELEPGDHLLTWAGDRETPRYCHLANDEEINELCEATGLAHLATFHADGSRSTDNRYVLLSPR